MFRQQRIWTPCDSTTDRMSSLETENWESGKVYRTDSGDMVRSKQERLVANLLTSEGISFEYERELSSWDGSSRYPDFTLFINGDQYYWEHWGMVDDYSYRQYIAKKIKWYREHGYYDCLIQTWGGGDRDLRGQVLAELFKLRKRKQTSKRTSATARQHRNAGVSKRLWGWVIPLAIILAFFLFLFFSSRQRPEPVAAPEAPKAISQKREPEAVIHNLPPLGESRTEEKKKMEIFYMGIKISR